MNLRLIKTVCLFCLAFCLAGGVFAQKNKIKNRTQSDSTKVGDVPKPGGGKSSIKNRVVVVDSSAQAIADSSKTLANSETVPGDSSQTMSQDSLVKPRKRFYTRVKENDLSTAESRAENLRMRIEIAEDRLSDYRNGNNSDESIKFSPEELDQFAASIDLAKQKLNRADSSLLAVRNKLEEEGRLNIESSEPEGAGGEESQEDDDDDDGEGDELADPSVSGGGKAALKGRSEGPEESGGKSGIKRKRKRDEPQEEDIDE